MPEKIFGAQEHIDRTEGKGGARVVGWFTVQREAEIFNGEVEGVSGTPNDLPVVDAMLYDRAVEHPDFNEPEAVRQRRIRELEAELADLRAQKPGQ